MSAQPREDVVERKGVIDCTDLPEASYVHILMRVVDPYLVWDSATAQYYLETERALMSAKALRTLADELDKMSAQESKEAP